MNQKQKTVLLCTAVVVGLLVLFPPYVVMSGKQVVIKSGYGFLFDLPPLVSIASSPFRPQGRIVSKDEFMGNVPSQSQGRIINMRDIIASSPTTFTIPATVNVATLLIQIFAVLVVGGLVYLALKKG